ncbi:MAG: RNA-directed DNA polymerase [Aeromonas sp.]
MLETILTDMEKLPPIANTLRETARAMMEEEITTEDGARAVEERIAMMFPDTWRYREQRPKEQRPCEKPREHRRKQYAAIQRLLNTNRKDAAAAVLDGSWREAWRDTARGPEGLVDFWSGVIGQSGPPAKTPGTTSDGEHWALLDPISVEELRGALRSLTNKAVGMDKVTATNLLSWHLPSLASLLNLILVTESLPAPMARARITLIPKIPTPTNPNDYRPLAISSILTRALHKVIARRMRDQLEFSPSQYAFLQRDGCLEASMVLHAALRNAHDYHRPLAMALLDLSKAFDTVTHEVLGEAAMKAGLPTPLLRYVNSVLRNSESIIGPNTIKAGRGVRQGDPLSPILFILAMERPISEAHPELGVELGSNHLHSILYADDMVLLANTPEDLQTKVDGLITSLAGCGMSLNARKSAALTIVKDGRAKAMILTPTHYNAGKEQIAPMGIGDIQKYLGLEFNWKGKVTPKRTLDLERMLAEVKAAPLKPQQRLALLKDFLIPRLTHGLVLGQAHRNTLRRMDLMVRRAIRLWLRLPKDTSLGLFHAPNSRGGLGILSLETHIPMAQKSRLSKLLDGKDSIIQAVTKTTAFQVILRRLAIPIRAGGTMVLSSTEARNAWTDRLISSVDGRELAEADVDGASHLWLKNPDRVFPRLYIRSLQLRGGTLTTQARATRGRISPSDERKCRGGCQAVETQHHILQRCAKTHDVRCARHNRIVRLVCKKLKRKEQLFSVEPIIPRARTHIKPDIIVHRTDDHGCHGRSRI